jgi:hypothetical protein
MKKFFIRYFTPSKWETVWMSRCTTRAMVCFTDHGRVSAVAKIQVERRKNKARALIEAMGESCEYSITEIALANPEAMAVCRRENISL